MQGLKSKQRQLMAHYGLDSQLQKLIEECGELIQAICKFKDSRDIEETEKRLQAMESEMADVLNLIQQYQLSRENAITLNVIYKVDRQIRRVHDEHIRTL